MPLPLGDVIVHHLEVGRRIGHRNRHSTNGRDRRLNCNAPFIEIARIFARRAVASAATAVKFADADQE